MSWEIIDETPISSNEQTPKQNGVSEITQTPILDQVKNQALRGDAGSLVETLSSANVPDLLTKFINKDPMEKAISTGVGGLTMLSANQKNAEDALPYAMGTIGGVLGGMVGHANLGVGVGTFVGDAEKQFIDKMKGQSDKVNLPESFIKGAGAGLLSKGLEEVFKIGGQTFNLIPERTRVEFYDNVRRATDVGYKILVRNYGRAVNKLVSEFPDKRIALNGTIEKISTALEGVVDDAGQPILSQIKRAVKNNPRLKDVVDDPSKAIGLTLQEANELKSTVTSTVKSLIKRIQKGGTATPQERGIFEILGSFDKEITKSFPQMRQINEIYAAGKHAYDLARPNLNPGVPVESAIMSKPSGLFGLGGTKFMGSTGGKLALKDTMSMTKAGEKMFRAAELSHNLNRAADAIGRWAEIGAGGLLVKKTWGRNKDVD